MPETNIVDDLVCVILPLVKMSDEKMIEMGPVRFWTTSELDKHIDSDIRDNFKKYVDKKEPKNVTCISVVDPELLLLLDDYHKYSLLGYAAHFLCFLSNVTSVGVKMSNINDLYPFIKMRLVTKKLLNTSENWGPANWFSYNVNKQAEISYIDKDFLKCFGKILATNYMSFNPRWARRVIRAIQSFNFVFEGEEREGEIAYSSFYYTKTQDIIFLSMALESLLDLHFASTNKKDTTAKFVKGIMTIIYDVPSEKLKASLENWLKEFYYMRSAIVHGDDISNIGQHVVKGVQAFYVTLNHQLQSHTCLKPNILQQSEMYDCLARLWTEKEVLTIIKDLLSWKRTNNSIPEERLRELTFLVTFFSRVTRNAPRFYFARKDEDEVRIKREIVDISERVSKCLKSLKELLAEKGLTEFPKFIEGLKGNK